MDLPIQIDIKTKFIDTQSSRAESRFVYKYTITIHNHSTETVQLISRHWFIESENKNVQEVQGMGVIGKQPVLQPSASYTYSSGAVIKTETGIMHGNYQMRLNNGHRFDVPIPAFALVPPHAIH